MYESKESSTFLSHPQIGVKAHDTVDIVLLENDRFLGDRILGELKFSVNEFIKNKQAGSLSTQELWFELVSP